MPPTAIVPLTYGDGMVAADQEHKQDSEIQVGLYHKGVKHLCDNGIKKVPNKYILPVSDRPDISKGGGGAAAGGGLHSKDRIRSSTLKLPIIDFAELQGPNRSNMLKSLSNACQQYGFFQLVNHGVPRDVTSSMIDVCKRFFELPFEERVKYMSSDMSAPVRYGTSFNQNHDGVFCWRDFLKLMCNPLPEVPSSPPELRKQVEAYTNETKHLFLMLMEAILESLEHDQGTVAPGTKTAEEEEEDDDIIKEFQDGSQLLVCNCYPPCPEPDLTLGLPPHSDYGFLTLLLQDEVKGLQIQFEAEWVTVEPIPHAFVVNVGDHLEIFSNGRYKSVLHRVITNCERTRVTVASLHSLPFKCSIQPWQRLLSEENPRRYMETDFATFLSYISSREPKKKSFLESRKLIAPPKFVGHPEPLDLNFKISSVDYYSADYMPLYLLNEDLVFNGDSLTCPDTHEPRS
ncbi:hypothetical protein Dimus_034682 [Dionaea muscipula]